jgi:3-oxoacyl-[acyl-carrier protein] reductase
MRSLCRPDGGTVHPVVAGFAGNNVADSVVAVHAARYGRLDVLVQSAGFGFHGEIANHHARWLDLEIQVNYCTPFCMLRSALPMLRAAGTAHQKALVANVASFSGAAPMARLASYSAAKAALIALSRAAHMRKTHASFDDPNLVSRLKDRRKSSRQFRDSELSLIYGISGRRA